MKTLEAIETKQFFLNRGKAFEEWYELAFPFVARFVRKMGGSFEDAKDVFQDALIIFYEKTSSSDFQFNTSEEAYILGIAKHVWIRKFNRGNSYVSLNDNEATISIPNDYFPSIDTVRLLNFLEQTGKKCLDLLRSFYYEKLPLKDIANKFGYQNLHSATVQKYKCLEKIRNKVKEKAFDYEDFFE